MRGLPRPLLLSKISRTIRSVSSCSLGTELNLKIKNSGKVPVALDDSQYPEWLWTVLDDEYQNSSLANDAMKQRKKDIRIMNIKKIKMNNFITKIK
ncbi:54S ribosomal protein L37, mitochondrial [Komagataella phaffii CBS 7435]|nr:54S ribosomal protein L37, mitochondrial [Komagataella phaffii CBS 7435]CCA40227.1 54S ribosomal protein L37, mitochondrial [Komagataella phaffii CBS 7435]